jgi:hypothetical protein
MANTTNTQTGTGGWESLFSDPDTWALVVSAINQSRNPDGIKHETTAEERWAFDRHRANQSYSPYRHFGGDAAMQAIQGLQNWKPNMTFMSDAMKGQQPLAGYQMPKIDFSKMPTPWRTAQNPMATGPGGNPGGGGSGSGVGAGSNPGGPRIGGGGPHSNGGRVGFHKTPVTSNDQNEVDARFGFGPSIYGGLTEDPHRPFTPDMIGANQPDRPNRGHGYGNQHGTGGVPGSLPDGLTDENVIAALGDRAGNALSWWQNFKQEHPNWAALGRGVLVGGIAAAIPGIGGALAAKVVNWLLSREGKGANDVPSGNATP